MMAKVEACMENVNPRDRNQKQKSIQCIRDQMKNLDRTIAVMDLNEGTRNVVFLFVWVNNAMIYECSSTSANTNSSVV